jgi:MFS family permease
LLAGVTQASKTTIKAVGSYLPAVFFFAGFIWDALTIGRNVAASDLIIFAGYLLGAGLILFLISRPSLILADEAQTNTKVASRFYAIATSRWPYFLLQFLFGSLLSALFILYFKSSSHWLAWLLSLLLAGLLVANEFLEDQYRRFTVSWALFGLCAMLLFNFALPFLLGSVLSIWFYLSTLLGALFAYWLYTKTPNHLGSIWPVSVIAGLLMLAYASDMIPPVPLVKRDIAMAYAIEKVNGHYQLSQQKSPWWVFWRKYSDDLEVQSGQRIYCFSTIFAPAGLKTKLFHDWQLHTKQGWVLQSRASFTVSGGRYNGFRGYTYKSNPVAGDWRVVIKTENEKTIAVHKFTVRHFSPTDSLSAPQQIIRHY